jgi:hypothetical protein
MAIDQKLISSLLDLSRNVDKLSGDIKKNTETTTELVSTQKKTNDSNSGIEKIAESIKGLNLKDLRGEFSGLTKTIEGLDLKNLSDDIKSLNFKDLSDSIKSLDIKGLIRDLRDLQFNSSSDLGGASDEKKIRNSRESQIISGENVNLIKEGKNILGSFADGGDVNSTGSYLVGERGPEVVKLNSGSAVISNNILKERRDILKKLGTDAPSEKEISRKRNELLLSDPDYYSDEPGWLEEDINSYLEGLQSKPTSLFTPEDLKKLSKPADNKAEELINPVSTPEKNDKKEKNKKDGPKLKEKKDGLFSKIFGKGDKSEIKGSEIVSNTPSKDKVFDKDSILTQGSSLLKGARGLSGNESAGKLNMAGDILSKGTELGKKIKMPSIETRTPELKTPEIKTDIKKLSPQPQPKSSKVAETKNESQSQEVLKNETIETGSPKSEAKTPESTNPNQQGTNPTMTSKDIEEMKAALVRIASLLEGPLNVAPMERPFRPDSRRI